MNIVKHIPRPMPLIEKIADMSYPKLLALWTGINVLCAAIYYYLATYHPGQGPFDLEHMDHGSRVWNSLYFSVMTATTTGYGDIVPHGFSKVVASFESVSAFLIFGIFLAKLSAQHSVRVEEKKMESQ